MWNGRLNEAKLEARLPGPSGQSYGFSSSHIRMWELDHKEAWAPKNWCFWVVLLEKTLESPLSQGDQTSQS